MHIKKRFGYKRKQTLPTFAAICATVSLLLFLSPVHDLCKTRCCHLIRKETIFKKGNIYKEMYWVKEL